MWSLFLVVTFMGMTREYALSGLYMTDLECQETISRLTEKFEVREEVEEATIQCFEHV